jgi:hypothetical protein
MASHPETKIDCSKVYVKRSSFATTEAEFDGAFAAVPIKKGVFVAFRRPDVRTRGHRIRDAKLCSVDSRSLCSRKLTFLYFPFTGELVEKGVMRRLPEGFDGNKSPYVFTWSNERPNKVRNDLVFLCLTFPEHGFDKKRRYIIFLTRLDPIALL